MEEEDAEDVRARLPLLIVIALLVLAAFAGVVWLAYNQGVRQGQAGTPTIVTAPEGPARTAPETQTAEAPLSGLSVYEAPVSPAQEAEASALAPAATSAVNIVPSEPVPVQPSAAPPPASPAVSASTMPLPPPPAPAAAPPAPRVAVVPPPPARAAVVPPAPARAVPAGVGAASGAAVLQIGAFPNQDLANGAWNNFRTRFGEAANGLSQDIQVANLGEKGTWYRLRVGAFTTKDAAATKCEQLKAAGGTCFVTAP